MKAYLKTCVSIMHKKRCSFRILQLIQHVESIQCLAIRNHNQMILLLYFILCIRAHIQMLLQIRTNAHNIDTESSAQIKFNQRFSYHCGGVGISTILYSLSRSTTSIIFFPNTPLATCSPISFSGRTTLLAPSSVNICI